MTTGQGLLPYTIEVVDDDATLTGHAGLPLVLETMRALGVSEVLDGALGIRRRNHGATDAQKAEALVLLMAAGGDSVDDIEVLLAHYKGGRGYQPSAIYWAELDVVLADEYRDGNVPAAMNNLPLIQRGFAALPPSVTALYFRADSACYETKILKWLANPERDDGPRTTIGFTISADMSEPLRRVCERLPEQAWTLCDDRPTETVMCADVEFAPGDWPKDAEPLRYVALRIRKKQGHLFGGGYDTKYLAVVSNRRELAASKLIRWHWEKAGTIEHVHDVTKNDLAAAVPPCGRFGANAAWYRLSLLTYNVLSAMKWLALPPSMETARPKRMRFALFSIAGRIVSHAGKLVLRIGREAEALASLIAARIKIAQVGLARIATASA